VEAFPTLFSPPVRPPVRPPGPGQTQVALSEPEPRVPPEPPEPPECLHPALWRAHQLGRQRVATCASGFDRLDAELPGGGWPTQGLSELLLPHPGVGEIRLLAPALAAVQQDERSVLLFDPPAALCSWTLAALGLELRHLVVVKGKDGLQGRARALLPAAEVLWALEQALKCGHVGAVLAWLPQLVGADALRRLQLAAQGHDGPAFLVRDLQVRQRPSPAPLRLLLAPAGPDELALSILKRRGPPLLQPLRLALPAVLSGPARARALQDATTPPAVALAALPAAAARA